MRLYVIAMLDEAKDIIKDYQLITDNPFLLYKNNNNLLAITNIGKVNSALVLTNILSGYQISEIINIGFVGSSNDYQVGDFLLVKNAFYHDFDISLFGYEKGQVPNLDVSLKPNSILFNKLDKHFNKAVLYTGDSFLTTPLKGAYIADMEGMSLFHVATLFNKPIISVKVVSDIIGNDFKDYQEFERVGSKNILSLYNKLEELL